MECNELMKALGAKLGVGGFEPDESGRYWLSVDDNVVRFAEVGASGLVDADAEICRLPEEGREQISRALLTAMAPGGTAEAYCFYFTPDGQSVCLRRTDALDRLDVEGLRTVLENFVNALEEWRDVIGRLATVAPVVEEAQERRTLEERQIGLGAEGFIRV